VGRGAVEPVDTASQDEKGPTTAISSGQAKQRPQSKPDSLNRANLSKSAERLTLLFGDDWKKIVRVVRAVTCEPTEPCNQYLRRYATSYVQLSNLGLTRTRSSYVYY
jgi:hypothetical protein